MPNLELSDCSFDAKGYANFDCVVDDYYVRPNQDGSKYSLNFKFRVASGPHTGKHIYADFWLSPAAWSYTQEKLEKVFGYNGGIPGLKAVVDGQEWMEHPVNVSVTSEEYQGKPKLKCSGMFAPNRPAKATNDDWDRLMAQHSAPPTAAIMPPAPAPAKAPPSEDDLPF